MREAFGGRARCPSAPCSLDIPAGSTRRVARGQPEVAAGLGGGRLREIAQQMSAPRQGVLDSSLPNQFERATLSHVRAGSGTPPGCSAIRRGFRSEEHTSELQSPMYLVCRLLLEK